MASFKLDENLPVEATTLLQAGGHNALSVLDQSLGGHSDTDIAAICRKEQRVLVTFDLGFADIRVYPPRDYSGIVVLRLGRQDKPHTLEIVEQLIPKFGDEPLENHLWIVSETSIRIRG